MKRFVIGLFMAVVLISGIAEAQYKGYPGMCTENSTVATPGSAEYMTCDEWRAGTSASTPTYTESRIRDGDGTLLADVVDLAAAVTAIANTENAAVVLAVNVAYDAAGATYYPVQFGLGSSARGMRVVLANDDPAVVDLAAIEILLDVMDDWDAVHNSAVVSDGPQIMIEGKDFDGAAMPNTVTEGNAVRPAGSLTGIQYVSLVNEDGSIGDPLATAGEDNGANTDDGVLSYCRLSGWDGSAWDRLTVDASSYLEVVDATTRAGEDTSNDWRKMKKEEVATYSPTKTSGTAVDSTGGGTTGDIVLASVEVLDIPNWCVWIKNAGGGSADDLAHSYVYVSPSDASGEWELLGGSDCGVFASGDGVFSVCNTGNAYRYVKVEALCDTGEDTTVDAWITGNKG